MHQVGFAQACLTVDKQRVVGASRRIGNGNGGGLRQLIATADHKVFKCAARRQGTAYRGMVELGRWWPLKGLPGIRRTPIGLNVCTAFSSLCGV